MFRSYQRLVEPNAAMRMDLFAFVQSGTQKGSFFDRSFIQDAAFLENVAIQDAHAKERFFRDLKDKIQLYPISYAHYKVLPELIKAIEFGASDPTVLPIILKIGVTLPEKDYKSVVTPPLLRLFASPDRALRMVLLENLELLVEHLDAKLINDPIFSNIATGFGDGVPALREATLKAVAILIPKLSEKIINNELIRHLTKMQTDSEPGIRTNTMICIGRIASHLSSTTRAKILLPAFTRALQDPFAFARTAGLKALAATIDYYNVEDCACKILPQLCPLLIDPDSQVRSQAAQTFSDLKHKVDDHVASLPSVSQPPVLTQHLQASGSDDSVPSYGSSARTTAAQGTTAFREGSISHLTPDFGALDAHPAVTSSSEQVSQKGHTQNTSGWSSWSASAVGNLGRKFANVALDMPDEAPGGAPLPTETPQSYQGHAKSSGRLSSIPDPSHSSTAAITPTIIYPKITGPPSAKSPSVPSTLHATSSPNSSNAMQLKPSSSNNINEKRFENILQPQHASSIPLHTSPTISGGQTTTSQKTMPGWDHDDATGWEAFDTSHQHHQQQQQIQPQQKPNTMMKSNLPNEIAPAISTTMKTAAPSHAHADPVSQAFAGLIRQQHVQQQPPQNVSLSSPSWSVLQPQQALPASAKISTPQPTTIVESKTKPNYDTWSGGGWDDWK